MLKNLITYRTSYTNLTVADILREYWPEYKKRYKVSPEQARVAGAVMACRTPALGGRVDQCGECGCWVFSFNSCRDRHCNQCQKFERAKWVEKQKIWQLPIPYFHVIFTTDHAINELVRENQTVIYNHLFQSAQKSLQQQAKEELGCQLGITAVLHTWGQKLDEHIHVHCIVSGGGLALAGSSWRSSGLKYLVDVKALSVKYRDKFCEGLKRLLRRGKLKLKAGQRVETVEAMLASIQAKAWEVFAKPFGEPKHVIEYLSRYVHQVAISNYRLEGLAEGVVRVKYHDNQAEGEEKVLRLPVLEFMRRWLLHILPAGFMRIRYYGLHHSSARKEKLPECRAHFGLSRALPVIKELVLLEWLQELLGDEANACPRCGAQRSMFLRREFEELPWLVALLLSLIGQPTGKGVRP